MTRRQKREPTAAEKSSANSRQYELKLGEVVDSNVGTVEYKNLTFTVQKDTEKIH